ncbi:GNAT family N-acetyltransferase [Dactylosporangium vinaceum]|uniref:GNAT family N-acetyltransferase n=1 Tax=Dactylosporangium vinaceum TaxID=53362 RepID=A0ABV5MR27_9ACTN|nr:GNAT family N-acetyltransferase [Dactylosporangium vinaceum]UAC00575.1 GNAT family N-acetyltransferase [Dactylosporangium vinaceum]
MSDTRVYRAQPADLAEILPLVEEFCAADDHPYDETRVARALAPLLAGDEHGQVWLVDADPEPRPGPDAEPKSERNAEPGAGIVVGYAVVTWGWSLESGGREALLDEIYVRRRGAGVGAVLLQRVLAAAVEAGAAVMFLETEAHNERVRGFYARHGFAADDSVWMSRALTSPVR